MPWKDNLGLRVTTLGNSKEVRVSDLPMQGKLAHGWDGLLCGIGMEHADKGITSKKLGFLSFAYGEDSLHFL